MITKDEERDLIVRAKAGDGDAAGKLIYAHEHYFRRLIRRAGFHRTNEDAMQEARLAALRCLPKFDLSRNLRFNTYASQRVSWDLKHYQENLGLIRVPPNFATMTDARKSDAAHARNIGSMDAPIYRSAHLSLLTVIPFKSVHILEQLQHSEMIGIVKRCMRKLPSRARCILRRRLEGETLAAIGVDFSISKERVRQIHVKAMGDVTALVQRACPVLMQVEAA